MNILIEGPQGCGKNQAAYSLIRGMRGVYPNWREVNGVKGAKELTRTGFVIGGLDVVIIDEVSEDDKPAITKLATYLRNTYGEKLIIITLIQKGI